MIIIKKGVNVIMSGKLSVKNLICNKEENFTSHKTIILNMGDYCDYYKSENYALPIENSLYLIEDIWE